MRSTADWSDCRYRAYTTNAKKAENFRGLPKIRFTDSGHGIVPSVHEHKGRREREIRTLSDYVQERLPTADKPKTVTFTVKFSKDEREAVIEALSRHLARANAGDVPEGDTPIEFFKSALAKV
ncbi:hypothetical protein CK227_10305 [Mesorhizobium sp. WSM4308]|nr:hypothetical protein CK227_10305 [Mesorhizobium sp. WSM4308]